MLFTAFPTFFSCIFRQHQLAQCCGLFVWYKCAGMSAFFKDEELKNVGKEINVNEQTNNVDRGMNIPRLFRAFSLLCDCFSIFYRSCCARRASCVDLINKKKKNIPLSPVIRLGLGKPKKKEKKKIRWSLLHTICVSSWCTVT